MVPLWKCDNCGFTFELDTHEMKKNGAPLHRCSDSDKYFFCHRVGAIFGEGELIVTNVRGVILSNQ